MFLSPLLLLLCFHKPGFLRLLYALAFVFVSSVLVYSVRHGKSILIRNFELGSTGFNYRGDNSELLEPTVAQQELKDALESCFVRFTWRLELYWVFN